LEGKDHKEKRHTVLLCDSHNKSHKEKPSNPPHKSPPKIALKITEKEK
jgi:hypothetical protein